MSLEQAGYYGAVKAGLLPSHCSACPIHTRSCGSAPPRPYLLIGLLAMTDSSGSQWLLPLSANEKGEAEALVHSAGRRSGSGKY